jgi:shikimate dehydrogenase
MANTMPTGSTKIVGLIGWPVAHSLSPVMHNAAFAALGLDYCYVAMPVSPEPARKLGQAVQGMRALGMRGCNVTVPHKERVISYADELTPFARLTGAVNTLAVEDDGRIVGDNTDGPGLVAYFEHNGVVVRDGRALVLGAGGSARAAVAGLLSAGCARITVLNRSVERAESLVRELARSFPEHVVLAARDGRTTADQSLRYGRFPQDIADSAVVSDIVVQCTSVGMGSDTLAWDPDTAIRPEQVVCDLVYHPRKTALLELAERSGARTLGGVGMLVFQGALSFQRWTGQPAPIDVMFRAVENVGQKT